MALQKFVRLPNAWIEGGGLKAFTWGTENRVEGLAALVTLMVIAQHADQETGEAKVTYEVLKRATGFSATTIAAGLGLLETRLVERGRQSEFKLRDFDQFRGFAFLPAKPLYNAKGQIEFFHELKLRKQVELNAVKLYLLIVSRRDRNSNLAHITVNKIEEYSGIHHDDIKRAVSFLAGNAMIHIEHLPRQLSQYGYSSAYRLAHLQTHQHMGTVGRNLDIADFEPEMARIRPDVF
jgi:hypothetical protein